MADAAIEPVVLDGRSMRIEQLVAIADGAAVALHPDATDRMARGRAVVERYLADEIPAYGLTTGLGLRAGEALTREQATTFSYRTVRGRAQAVGEPLDARSVRAVMAVRLNTILSGASGASAAVAPFIEAVLRAGVVPFMPSIGSIGSGDLVAMASMAHAFIGEGSMLVADIRTPATDVLRRHGVEALQLQPKDGAVLCNNTAFSCALAALAADAARHAVEALQTAGALSIAAFGGNASPFDAAALRLRDQPGATMAGDRIRQLLEGDGRTPRRLQDPLSMRCIASTNGAAFAAVDDLDAAVQIEINSSSDNPAVLLDDGRIVSTGNFHTPRLAQTLDTTSRALAWCATDSVSRVQRLASAATSGLPALLTPAGDVGAAGFGPMMKPLEALRAEVIHLANPVPIMASHNADGVEDAVTFSALAAQQLHQLVRRLHLVIAFELVAAAQAADLRGEPLPPALATVHAAVRTHSAFLGDDRPIADEVQSIACALVASGALAAAAKPVGQA